MGGCACVTVALDQLSTAHGSRQGATRSVCLAKCDAESDDKVFCLETMPCGKTCMLLCGHVLVLLPVLGLH
jgi:hypothetical protein